MTDEELDLIASAYVDGEATPEEVAMVERDPVLRARVEEFRSLATGAEPLPAPAGLAEAHLAVAMAEFERGRTGPGPIDRGTAGDGHPAGPTDGAEARGPAPVIDLRARAEARAAAPARSLPRWLPAAAAFVLIGGGLIWATGRGGSDDAEAFETAALDAESSDESSEADTATDTAADDAMAGSGADGDAAEDAGSMAAAPADSDRAADQEVAEEAELATSDDGDSEAGDDEGAGTAPTTTGGLPPGPLLSFPEVPDADDIEDLPEPITDLDLSRCGFEVAAPSLGEPLGFIPVEVAGEPVELFLFLQGDGSEIRLLIDQDCLPLEP
jgi:hypothetical protein